MLCFMKFFLVKGYEMILIFIENDDYIRDLIGFGC